MDIVKTNNLDCRRESVDSGFSVSPESMSYRVTRKNKKKRRLFSTLSASTFNDLYQLQNEVLGQGSCGRVETCLNIYTQKEYAVKIVNKENWSFNRQKMLKEIELYYMCQVAKVSESVIQLVDYFEDTDKFFLIFEKASGGHLLDQLNKRKRFSEKEVATIILKIATALDHLHSRGIAHRDLKPENILCMASDATNVASSVRLCDFDLCSKVQPGLTSPRLASPVGSPEYLAPEVVEVFLNEDNILYDLLDEDTDLTYDKKCDLWSLGVISYTLLTGVLPFKGKCGKDCGWEDRNEECMDCQNDLFENIQNGVFEFPPGLKLSSSAKDLIVNLLKIDPEDRLESWEILEHPWIVRNTSRDSEHVDNIDNIDNIPAMNNKNLRKSMSLHDLSSSDPEDQMVQELEQPAKIQNSKFRRQSSIVVTSFCHQPREDLLCRCEL